MLDEPDPISVGSAKPNSLNALSMSSALTVFLDESWTAFSGFLFFDGSAGGFDGRRGSGVVVDLFFDFFLGLDFLREPDV